MCCMSWARKCCGLIVLARVVQTLAMVIVGAVDIVGIAASLKRARFQSRWINIMGVSLGASLICCTWPCLCQHRRSVLTFVACWRPTAWALADSVMSKFMPLWFTARGTEFTWQNIQMGIDANIKIVWFLALTCLVWVSSFARRTPALCNVAIALVLAVPAFKECVCCCAEGARLRCG